MAYYTSTVNSAAALVAQINAHAQADGWSVSGNYIYKAGGPFVTLTSSDAYVGVRGYASAAGAEASPSYGIIGKFTGPSGAVPMDWSLTFSSAKYEYFGFANEIYVVVNYMGDKYQYLAFGKSTIPGLPGAGTWYGATHGYNALPTAAIATAMYNTMKHTGSRHAESYIVPALFWGTRISEIADAYAPYRVHHDLDGLGWGTLRGNDDVLLPKVFAYSPDWNAEHLLYPIQAWAPRTGSKSLVGDLQHARYARLGNLSPEQVISFGTDKWKVFPWCKKDATIDPDKSITAVASKNEDATGTYGWAIKYEGP